MKHLTNFAQPRNFEQLDLFKRSAPTSLHIDNRAASKIAGRFGISIPHALVITRLAGLGFDGQVR